LSFDSADTDQNGSLSLDEFSAIGKNVPRGKNGLGDNDIQSLFSAIDTDGDGQISKTEAKTAFDKLSQALQSQLLNVQEQLGSGPPSPPTAGDIFTQADTDGNGSLSLDEFKAAAASHHRHHHAAGSDDSKIEARFNALDSNGDGTVSQSELESAFAAGPPSPPSASDIFKQADSDGNGSLSLDEFKAEIASHHHHDGGGPSDGTIENRFNAMDSNGDGAISQSELESAFAAGPPSPGAMEASQFAAAASAYQAQSGSTDIVKQLIDILQAA
jgi:Ca2+-binding EF-hand superfamily protein